MLEFINIFLVLFSLVLVILPIKKIVLGLSFLFSYIIPKNEKINKLQI